MYIMLTNISEIFLDLKYILLYNNLDVMKFAKTMCILLIVSLIFNKLFGIDGLKFLLDMLYAVFNNNKLEVIINFLK